MHARAPDGLPRHEPSTGGEDGARAGSALAVEADATDTAEAEGLGPASAPSECEQLALAASAKARRKGELRAPGRCGAKRDVDPKPRPQRAGARSWGRSPQRGFGGGAPKPEKIDAGIAGGAGWLPIGRRVGWASRVPDEEDQRDAGQQTDCGAGSKSNATPHWGIGAIGLRLRLTGDQEPQTRPAQDRRDA